MICDLVLRRKKGKDAYSAEALAQWQRCDPHRWSLVNRRVICCGRITLGPRFGQHNKLTVGVCTFLRLASTCLHILIDYSQSATSAALGKDRSIFIWTIRQKMARLGTIAVAVAILMMMVGGAWGDVYMLSPRGCNNRLNEESVNRNNNNRMCDTQVPIHPPPHTI
jgi:hypothetical protein